MFIYNLKLSKNAISSIFIILALIIIISIISFGVYIIFFKSNSKSACDVKSDEIVELTESNYTNILKASSENIDSYTGTKVHVIGYVYRLLDFDENQFVIARDMKFGEDGNSLVVGFLCNYNKASLFADGTWVEIVGEIKKGKFNDDIAILDVISIEQTNAPQNIFVNPPDNTYIPTSAK